MEFTENDCKIRVIFHTDNGDKVFALIKRISTEKNIFSLWYKIQVKLNKNKLKFRTKIANITYSQLYYRYTRLKNAIIYRMFKNYTGLRMFKAIPESVYRKYHYKVNKNSICVRNHLYKLSFSFYRLENIEDILRNVEIKYNGINYRLDELITLLKLSNAEEAVNTYIGVDTPDSIFHLNDEINIEETKSLAERMIKLQKTFLDESEITVDTYIKYTKKKNKIKKYAFISHKSALNNDYIWAKENGEVTDNN